MPSRRRLFPALIVLAFVVFPLLLLVFAALLTYSTLPSLEVLTDYRPRIPLRVFSADGALLGEFGEERRALVKIEDVPLMMKEAILAAEDDRFYLHGGVDYLGVLRAALSNFASGGVKQGASTITMQVARNFFLSKERTLSRKFNEVLLAFKIEHNLSKDEILQLYINHIYLGQRAYGFAAAAQIYFGKTLPQLTLAETAMLAGLPKAPSTYNPVVNPERAKLRQEYVLRRMRELDYITQEQFEAAKAAPIILRSIGQEFDVPAGHLVEMVRQYMYDRYQEDSYALGFNVYTTIRKRDQLAAYQAVRRGVLDYDARHGYRGPEGYINLRADSSQDFMEEALQEVAPSGDLLPAIVLKANSNLVQAYVRGGQYIEISGEGLHFVQRALANQVAPTQRIRTGSLIRVRKNDKGVWMISQLPQVEAALVSADPQTGALYALIGGFDFNRNQYNHVTQAWRQPGSSFKPFIYSAALEKGYTPATLVNDAPLMFDAQQTGGEPWQPRNFDGEFDGPITMRKALVKSKNLASVRILQAIGPEYAQDYVSRFGFAKEKVPPYLTMALGAGLVTPLQMLSGYAVFANGGFRVTPYFIDRIEDAQGRLIEKGSHASAANGAERVIDVRNAYTMVSMMQDVVRHGTATRAMSLGRNDLAGKTGTTSDAMDAWFCGFQPTRVAVAWIGYDQPRSLGEKESGAVAALPIWIDYMRVALQDVPEASYILPENMVAQRVDAAGRPDPNGEQIEYFYQENVPSAQDSLFPDSVNSARDQVF